MGDRARLRTWLHPLRGHVRDARRGARRSPSPSASGAGCDAVRPAGGGDGDRSATASALGSRSASSRASSAPRISSDARRMPSNIDVSTATPGKVTGIMICWTDASATGAGAPASGSSDSPVRYSTEVESSRAIRGRCGDDRYGWVISPFIVDCEMPTRRASAAWLLIRSAFLRSSIRSPMVMPTIYRHVGRNLFRHTG